VAGTWPGVRSAVPARDYGGKHTPVGPGEQIGAGASTAPQRRCQQGIATQCACHWDRLWSVLFRQMPNSTRATVDADHERTPAKSSVVAGGHSSPLQASDPVAAHSRAPRLPAAGAWREPSGHRSIAPAGPAQLRVPAPAVLRRLERVALRAPQVIRCPGTAGTPRRVVWSVDGAVDPEDSTRSPTGSRAAAALGELVSRSPAAVPPGRRRARPEDESGARSRSSTSRCGPSDSVRGVPRPDS